MVTSIAIHLEGGGNSEATISPFRQGMSTFLQPIVTAARTRGIRWRIIPYGGRSQAFKYFCDAIKNERDVFHVLLVDAEVALTASPWKHLKSRVGDAWKKPENVTESQCQLMVVMMETWFLADPDAVKEFLKHTKGFDRDALPPAPPLPTPPKLATVLESMSKAKVSEILAKATRDTKTEHYEKIKHGAKLLGKIDSQRVRQQCPSCDRLFRTLADAMGTTI
jgi:hypothetical protein